MENVEMIAGKKHAPKNLGRVLILGLGKSGTAAAEYCLDALGSRVETLAVAAGAPGEAALAWAEGARERGAVVLFDPVSYTHLPPRWRPPPSTRTPWR